MTFTPLSAVTVTPWAQLSARTRSDFLLGVNFQILASEQFPMIASEDAPLRILESGFSTP